MPFSRRMRNCSLLRTARHSSGVRWSGYAMSSEFEEDLLLKRLEMKGIMDDLRVVRRSDVVLRFPRGGSRRLVKKAFRMRRKGVGRIKMDVW